jgi:uncharacterized protein with HEPN domain
MPKRDLELYLQDILDSILAIEEYVDGLDIERFKNDRKTYSATIREFEIIGEAVGNIIDEEIIKNSDNISWRDIKDFRNILIHEYFGVDVEIVYNTIKQDLPPLKNEIVNIINIS